MKWARHAERMG